MEWYSKTTEELLRSTGCHPDCGLSEPEAEKRLHITGPNRLAEEKRPGIFSCFFSQFKDFMILTLLAAAAISFLVSYLQGETDFADPCIILAIVIINAIIGVFQEQKAEHSLQALQAMQTPKATVIRDRKTQTIDAAFLVPGDIVILETGARIPADGRVLSCQNLSTEESALTGETGTIAKHSAALPAKKIPLGDRTNMVFAGTNVAAGRGIFLVTATGMDTEIGRIAGMLSYETAPETPLTKRLNKTGKMLGIIALIICVILFFIGIYQHKPVFSMFMTSVSLGVAAIPESLPALVTIMLSLGVERMAKKQAVIRHLPAVETLGCATVICSDKTGTLTENRMSVERYYSLCDVGFLMKLFLLCNNDSGPMEHALIQFAAKQGQDYKKTCRSCCRILELPFDSGRKCMTTLNRDKNGYRSVTKGAPEIIICRSRYYQDGDEKKELTPEMQKFFLRKAEEFAQDALRVLAVGYRLWDVKKDDETLEEGLVFVGFVGLMDPPRKEALPAVLDCKNAGITPVMITGDHAVTATAIGKSLGICAGSSEVLTGAELDAMTDTELSASLHRYHVFARVSPAHKVRLVKLYQQKGNVVAMTGDGVNDAPALKAADIGCAMGRGGTDVAKNASDMILLDDNFSTIVSAIQEGRGIYDNIKKAIHFLLSCNIGEIMTIFSAILFGLEVPLLPVQLLFINLITDSFPALCLGVEKPERNIMRRPPVDARKGIFESGSFFQILVEGLFIGSLALVAYILGNSTTCFAVLSLAQLTHSFNMRSQYSLKEIGVFSNKKLLFSVALCVSLLISVICFSPLQMIFHTTSLTIKQWCLVATLSLLPLPLVELEKRL